MRISVSPPATDTTAVRFISAVQRQSGSSVEPASSRRSNFDMTPHPRRKCMCIGIGRQVRNLRHTSSNKNRCRIFGNTLKKHQVPPPMVMRPSKAMRQVRVVSKLSDPFRQPLMQVAVAPCCGPVLNCSSPQFSLWVCLFSTSSRLIFLVFWIRHDKGTTPMKKLSLGMAAVLALLSIAGCAQYIGKGKAPPPAAPVVTKG
jgi:hypothetical protein